MHGEAKRIRTAFSGLETKQGILVDVARVAALTVVYFYTAKLGLKLASLNASATAVWPPTGIALAAVLLLGYRVWPGIWLGAFLANIMTAGTIFTSMGIATGNTLEALVGVWLVQRFANGRHAFEVARDIFRFVFLAAILATAVCATIGVNSLALGGLVRWDTFFPVWLTWWLGDAVSALVLMPLIVVWYTSPFPQWTRRQITEAVLILAVALIVSVLAFGGPFAEPSSRYPRFLLFPVLLWAAYRFGQRGAVSAAFLVSSIAIWGTLRGFGPFVSANLNESLLLLQTFMGTATMTNLVLAAVVSERQRSQAALQEVKQRIDNILENVSDSFCAFDRQWRFTYLNARAIQSSRQQNWSREQLLGKTLWDFPGWMNSRLEPELKRVMQERTPVIHEFRDVVSDEWFEARIDPTAEGIAVFQRNITSRKREEEAHRELVERERFARATAEQARAEAEKDLAARRQAEEALGRWVTEPLPHESRSPLRRYGVAALLVVGAVSLRLLVDPILGNRIPLVTSFAAVALAAWYGGWGAALFTMVASYVCAQWFFVEPRHVFDFDMSNIGGFGLYFLSGLIIVGITEAMRRAQRHAHASARVAVQRQQNVEAEMEERKQAENALRLNQEMLRDQFSEIENLYKASPVGMALMNTRLRYVRINERLAAINGLPVSEHIGRSLREVLPELADSLEEIHQRVITSGEPVLNQEISGTTPAEPGVQRHWLASYHPVRAANGNVMGVGATVQDITERKLAEARIQKLNDELEARVIERTAELMLAHEQLQAEIDKRKHLEAQIAHASEREQLRLGQELHDGLGQRLAGVGFMMGALEAKLANVSPACASDANRLQKMIAECVEQTRSLAHGFYPVELEQHGLLFALEDIAHRTRQSFGVSCVLQSDEPTPVALKGPPAIQLFRIAQEAVHNAVKHAQAKQIVIRLSTIDGNICLTIQDDGQGLPPDLDVTQGMGLHIMHYRARMIGGILDVRNDSAGGVVVTCSVPGGNGSGPPSESAGEDNERKTVPGKTPQTNRTGIETNL